MGIFFRRLLVCSLYLGLFNSSFGQHKDLTISNDTTIYGKVDRIPRFPGGNNELTSFFKRHINFHKYGRKKLRKTPPIHLILLIEKDGIVSSIQPKENCIDQLICWQVFDAIKLMPTWVPATLEGQNVRYAHHLQINPMALELPNVDIYPKKLKGKLKISDFNQERDGVDIIGPEWVRTVRMEAPLAYNNFHTPTFVLNAARFRFRNGLQISPLSMITYNGELKSSAILSPLELLHHELGFNPFALTKLHYMNISIDGGIAYHVNNLNGTLKGNVYYTLGLNWRIAYKEAMVVNLGFLRVDGLGINNSGFSNTIFRIGVSFVPILIK